MTAANGPWWAAGVTTRSRARSYTVRGVIGACAAACAVVATAGFALTGPAGDLDRVDGQGTVYQAPTARAVAYGCDSVVKVSQPTSRVGWIETDAELPYQGYVPAAGWFARVAPEPGAITATPEQVLRGMWSGERAAWYSPDAAPETVDALHDMVRDHPEWNMRVWEWPAERRDQLPAGYQVAFASWGVSQICSTPDAQVVSALLSHAPAAPGADGQTPPAILRPDADEPAADALDAA